MVFWISGFFLTLERVWVSFWPVVTLALLIMALAGFGVLAAFPAWLHLAVLISILTAAIYFILRPFKAFAWPRRRDVLQAIETQSHLRHAPLQLLDDSLPDVFGGKAIALWEHARQQAQQNVTRHIKIYRPWPAIADQDRHGLRHAVGLLFVLFILTSQGAASQRVEDGLLPSFSAAGAEDKKASLEAWITAPDYTGKAPVILASSQQQNIASPLALPENSVLHLRMNGYRIFPSVKVNGDSVLFDETTDGAQSADVVLTASGRLSVRHILSSIVKTDIEIIPDQAPQLKLFGTEAAHMGGLRLSYSTKDDYGITRLSGTLATTDRRGYPSEITFEVPAPSQSAEMHQSIQDFSSLAVAGSMAMLTLTAEDAAGHTVTTMPVQVAVPEREFKTPTAAALAYERKRLLAFDNAITRKLAIYGLLEAIRYPANYKGDPVIFMGMLSAIKRLGFDRDGASVDSVAPLLWDMAIRLEDGGLMAATVDASKALENLQKTLADKNASSADIANAMAEAQKAMNSYMQAFAREMMQRVQQGQKPLMLSPELSSKLSQRIDMGALAKAMEMMRQMNDRASMEKLAKQMQNALQSLDLNKMDQMTKQTQAALQALDALPPLIADQRTLYDITRLMEPGATEDRLPLAQEKLRERLDSIMKGMKPSLSVPESFQDAAKNMSDSAQKLRKGDNIEAAIDQDAALKALQKGFDSATQQMAAMMQQRMTFMPGFGSTPQPGKTDPFGRGIGNTTESDVTLPDQEQQGRVQKIIRDLRNRANDHNRSKVERDYIDRLLDIMN